MSITSEIERIQAAKTDIATSLTNKGVTVPETARIDEYAPLIDGIEAGGNYQVKSVVPTAEYQVVTPDEGYDALERVLVANTPLQESTVTPSRDTQIIVPTDNNIGLSKVTVNGDDNLFPSLIKKDVTIFGVTGTFTGNGGSNESSSNYSDIGTTVSVDARYSFYAGDRFVGIKNEDAVPEMNTVVVSGGSNIAATTKDGSVIIHRIRQLNTATSIKVGFLNSEDGTYTDINFPISGAISNTQSIMLDYKICNLNEDGTKMATMLKDNNNVAGVLLVNIDKTARTASAIYTTDLAMTNLEITVNGTTYNDGYVYSINNSGVAMIGDYLLVAGEVKYNSGSSKKACYLSFYVGSSSARFDAIVTQASPTYPIYAYSIGYPSEGIAIVNAYSMYWKLSYTDGIKILQSFSTSACTYATISRNGRYCSNHGSAYLIDFTNSTLTKLFGIANTGYPSWIDNAGEYMLAHVNNSTADIYEIATGNVFMSGVNACMSRYFGITGGEFYLCNGTSQGGVKCFVSYPTAQYSIYPTQAYIETADRIYGIVPENMTMGDVGTAQALFNTFGLEV